MLFSTIMRATSLGMFAILLAGVATAQEEDMQLSNIMTAVNYTDPYDGAELRGYSAVPGDLNPKDKKDARPVVIVVPDWDGVNE